MKEFDRLYFKHMLEKKTSKAEKANKKEVGKRVKQELMSYIDQRKEDMSSKDYSKVTKMIKDISTELDPEKIFDDLMKVGKVVGLKDSFSRVVGKVVSIVDELENEETVKADIMGEPEAEPEADMEPPTEGEPEGDLDLGMEPEGEPEGDLDLGMEPEGEPKEPLVKTHMKKDSSKGEMDLDTDLKL